MSLIMQNNKFNVGDLIIFERKKYFILEFDQLATIQFKSNNNESLLVFFYENSIKSNNFI